MPIHGDGGGGGTNDGRRPECTHTYMYACVLEAGKRDRDSTNKLGFTSLCFALAKLKRSDPLSRRMRFCCFIFLFFLVLFFFGERWVIC
jgi:hypothetical protein